MPGGNPYHDELGRFTDGPSGGGASAAAAKGLAKSAKKVKKAKKDSAPVEISGGTPHTATAQSAVSHAQPSGAVPKVNPHSGWTDDTAKAYAEAAKEHFKAGRHDALSRLYDDLGIDKAVHMNKFL